MQNTYVPDADMVYSRVPQPLPSDMVDLDFFDMQPVMDEVGDTVGSEPFSAVVLHPVVPLDYVGVGEDCAVLRPDTGGGVEFLGRPCPDRGLNQDDLETEEFHAQGAPGALAAMGA